MGFENAQKKSVLLIIVQMDAICIGFFDGDEVYIVPLSFGFEEKEGRYTFYMHGAKAGRYFAGHGCEGQRLL